MFYCVYYRSLFTLWTRADYYHKIYLRLVWAYWRLSWKLQSPYWKFRREWLLIYSVCIWNLWMIIIAHLISRKEIVSNTYLRRAGLVNAPRGIIDFSSTWKILWGQLIFSRITDLSREFATPSQTADSGQLPLWEVSNNKSTSKFGLVSFWIGKGNDPVPQLNGRL